MTYAQLVADGAALLDLVGPPDWRKAIDLDWLNMEDTRHCVAGQIFGGWDETPDDVRMHDAFGGHLDIGQEPRKWGYLKRAWVAYLTP